MNANGIIPLAQAAGTGMLEGAGRYLGNSLGSMGAQAIGNATGLGSYGTGSIGNAAGTTRNLSDPRMMLDAQQQMNLLNQQQQADARFQQGMQRADLGYTAELTNQVRNNDSTRAMAIEAQKNAATNVANQLMALNNARANNTDMIKSAMATGASLR